MLHDELLRQVVIPIQLIYGVIIIRSTHNQLEVIVVALFPGQTLFPAFLNDGDWGAWE